MDLSNRIKELRLAHGLTQEDLGKQIGVQKSAVAKYENGRVENMKRSTIQKLSELFKVSPTYIMGWEDEGIKKDIEKKELKIKELEKNIKDLKRDLDFFSAFIILAKTLGVSFENTNKKIVKVTTNEDLKFERFRVIEDRSIELDIKESDYTKMTYTIYQFISFQIRELINNYIKDN